MYGESEAVGPMGPMMGGWWDTPGWLVLALLVVLFALVLGAVTFAALATRGRPEPRRPPSPDEILRERYARGEIGRQQYLAALEDTLKDRYVRGELTLDEYEARLDLLLGSPLARSRQELEQRERPASQH